MAASDDRIHKKGIPSHLFCAIMILQKSLWRARKTKGSTIMSDIMQFSDRAEFRQWLSDNCRSGAGVWLLFGKAGGPKTLGAGEALEEALCFGWIDGQMQSIDDTAYRKYFSPRREKSKWSEKNKALAAKLEEQGLAPTLANYRLGKDLPSMGWDYGPIGMPPEKPHGKISKVTRCPLAEVWKSLGEEGLRLGRYYCWVDQAKYAAYGKGYRCLHDKNTMDGDDTAEVEAVMTGAEMKELIAELDSLCEKYPDRE